MSDSNKPGLAVESVGVALRLTWCWWGFLREGKGEAVAEDLKKLGLGNILSRSHQAFFVSDLPVQNSGLGLWSGRRQSRRVKDE